MAGEIKLVQDIISDGFATLKGIPNGVDPQDAVNVQQLDAAVAALVISWKDAVRAASTGNVDVANPGAAIDGVTLQSGDRILLKDQTTASQNGIYIFNGASTPLTRSTDADIFDELEQAIVAVEEGTANASTFWRQTQLNGTIDVDDVLWSSFLSATPVASETVAGIIEIATQAEVDAGVANNLAVTPLTLANWAGRKLKFCADIGDGTNTVFNVTHNLNTEDIHIEVYENAAPQGTVLVQTERVDANTARICFKNPPTSNQYRVCVLG
jgi:hypothetical protein